MKRIIHAPLVALFLAPACDQSTGDFEDALELEDDDSSMDDEEDSQEPDTLASERASEAAMLRVWFQGPCSDAASRAGFASLTIERRGQVRARVYDSMMPDETIPMTGKVSAGGSFEAVEYTPFGECTWYGLIDLRDGIAYGGWDCGQGCAGEWSIPTP